MKHFFITAIVLSISLYSCTSYELDESLTIEQNSLDLLNSNVADDNADIKYLYLNLYESDGIYKLQISMEDAIKAGVSEERYTLFISELNKANKEIIRINSTEPSQNSIPTLSLSSVSRASEKDLIRTSGRIETFSTEDGYDFCYTPNKISHIRFYCISNQAYLPVFKCQINALGVITYKTVLGCIGSPTCIDVEPANTQIELDLYFQTSDSNGGICSWTAEGIE